LGARHLWAAGARKARRRTAFMRPLGRYGTVVRGHARDLDILKGLARPVEHRRRSGLRGRSAVHPLRRVIEDEPAHTVEEGENTGLLRTTPKQAVPEKCVVGPGGIEPPTSRLPFGAFAAEL
jgi:hypothetical protein